MFGNQKFIHIAASKTRTCIVYCWVLGILHVIQYTTWFHMSYCPVVHITDQ